MIISNKFNKYFHYNFTREHYFAGHTHAEWEINVVTSGVLQVTYDDRVVTLEKNMLMIAENNVFHRNRVKSDENVELFVYQFFTDRIPHSDKPRIYELDEKDMALIKIIEEEAEKECMPCTHPEGIKSTNINYQADKLLEILIMRLMERDGSYGRITHPDEKTYRNIVNYMKENVTKNICIEDIARHCHLSPTKIKNVFAKYTGVSIMSHYSNMKINMAKSMLEEGMSVGEVSNALGYSSQAYLTTVFKKATGLSPKNFKKSDG